MSLEVNKSEMSIMGIFFEYKNDFRRVWHALSTNIFEGWEPSQKDVLHLKEKAKTLREERHDLKTV